MKRSMVVILAILLALAALLAGAAYRVYRLTKPNIVELKNNLKIDQSYGELNLLIAGIDNVDRVHRSDSILLVRIDLDHKRIKAMSIPRDTRIMLKGHGQQKINAAYAYGGVNLLRDTVVNLTGAPVNYTVVINYDGFPEVIDAMGGVEIDVPKRMVYTDRAQNLHINLQPGLQRLDGKRSLEFVRFRKDALGDEGRIKRQQQFLKAVLQELQKPSVALKIPDIVNKGLEMVKTDMPSETALQLALYMRDMNLDDVELFTMPGQAAYIKGLSYWVADLKEASIRFNTWPELNIPQPQGTNEDGSPAATSDQTQEAPADKQSQLKAVRDAAMPLAMLNGTGKSGLSKQAAQRFEKLGVAVEYQGNAKHYDYHYSVIHYPNGRVEDAKKLAALFDIPLNLVSMRNVPQVSLVLGKDYERLFALLDAIPLEE